MQTVKQPALWLTMVLANKLRRFNDCDRGTILFTNKKLSSIWLAPALLDDIIAIHNAVSFQEV